MEEVINKLDLILNKFEILEAKINIANIDDYQSINTEGLFQALAKANTEFPLIPANRKNVYIGTLYSDLDEIMKRIRPILAKNGLSVTIQEKIIDKYDILVARVWHKNQWIESRTRIDNRRKEDINYWGSYITKKKRFLVMNLLNLTIKNDKYDDDCEIDDEEKVSKSGSKLNTLYRKSDGSQQVINRQQYDILMDMLDDLPGYVEEIMESLNISTLRNMPEEFYKPTVSRINNKRNQLSNIR